MVVDSALYRELDYGFDFAGNIRNQLANHSGSFIALRELAQNADDASPLEQQERLLEFDFRFSTHRLVARNQGAFTDSDLERIRNIGMGGKRGEVETIGNWGVGFVSVYQLSDRPEIIHGRQHFVLCPDLRKVLVGAANGSFDFTEIVLPFRQHQSDFGRAIDRSPVNEEELDELVRRSRADFYRLLLFLRRINQLRVLVDGRLLYEFTKSSPDAISLDGADGIREELVDFSVRIEESAQSLQHRWYHFRARLPGLTPEGKHNQLTLAFCGGQDELARTVVDQSRLHVGLPTEIVTGLPFAIDASFYPSGNRKSLETSSAPHRAWNVQLLNALADLYVPIVPRLTREAGSDAAWFYRQLPPAQPVGTQVGPEEAYGQRFATRLFADAASLPLVYTSGGQWVRPAEARAAAPALFAFARDHVPDLAVALPDSLREVLRHHGLRDWTIRDLLELLRQQVPAGTQLEQAHPLIATRERLAKLYRLLEEAGIRRDADTRDAARAAPIMLAEDGTLQPPSAMYRTLPEADRETRRLLAGSELRLIESDWQRKHERMVAALGIRTFDTPALLGYLERISPECEGKSVDQAHPFLRGWERLEQVYRFAAERGGPGLDWSRSACFPDQQGVLRRPGDLRWLERSYERTVLKNVPHVHFRLSGESANARMRSFLRDGCGIPELSIPALFDALRGLVEPDRRLTEQPVFSQFNDLLRLYALLSARVTSADRETNRQLRDLPVYLTADEHLRPANKLYLGVEGAPQEIQCLVKLHNLLHPGLQDGRIKAQLGDFFERVVWLQPMSPVDLIREGVLRNCDEVASPSDRKRLLAYVATNVAVVLNDPVARGLLRDARLVRCEDGEYRSLAMIYYPVQPALRELLGECHGPDEEHYHLDGRRRPPSEPNWAEFFEQTSRADLGPHAGPRPADLVAIAREVADGPMDDARVKRAVRLLEHIDQHWRTDAKQALSELKSLAWLPGLQRRDRWFRPGELYLQGLRSLLPPDQPVLDRFQNPNAELLRFLGIKTLVEPSVCAAHLRGLYERREPPDNPHALYANLGRNSEVEAVRALSGQVGIWDDEGKRYWRPETVFLSDVRSEFGDLRLWYRSRFREETEFLKLLGAHEGAPTVSDRVAFLVEVAASRSDSPAMQVPECLQALLFRNYAVLGDAPESVLKPLGHARMVLTTDGRMAFPQETFLEDRPGIVEHFDPGALPIAETGDDPGVHKFLYRIGLRSLSDWVERELVSDTSTARLSASWEKRIGQLVRPIARLYAGTWEPHGSEPDQLPRWFSEPRIRELDDLQAGYVMPKAGVKSKPFAVPAYLDQQTLYIDPAADASSQRTYRIARALAEALAADTDDDARQDLFAERLASVLDCGAADEAMRFLDSREVPRLSDEEHPQRRKTEAPATPSAQPSWTEPILVGREPSQPDAPARASVDKSETVIDRSGTTSTTGAAPITRPPNRRAPTQATQLPLEPEAPQPAESTPRQPPRSGVNRQPPPFRQRQPYASPSLPNNPFKIMELARQLGATEDNHLQQWALDAADASGTAGRAAETEQASAGRSAQTPTEARFCLRYKHIEEGFLSLHEQAQQLLADCGTSIRCQLGVERQDLIELYVDREQGVLYNQTELPKWFLANGLEGGAIIKLTRSEGGIFRLDYIRERQVVTEVKQLWPGAEGKPEVTTVDKQLHFRVNEEVYRAEKRFEDLEALWQEAAQPGQGGVYQTVLAVFEEAWKSSDTRRCEHGRPILSTREVIRWVQDKRMLAVFSIRQVLASRRCFVPHDGGYCLDPSRITRAESTPAPHSSSGPTDTSRASPQDTARRPAGSAAPAPESIGSPGPTGGGTSGSPPTQIQTPRSGLPTGTSSAESLDPVDALTAFERALSDIAALSDQIRADMVARLERIVQRLKPVLASQQPSPVGGEQTPAKKLAQLQGNLHEALNGREISPKKVRRIASSLLDLLEERSLGFSSTQHDQILWQALSGLIPLLGRVAKWSALDAQKRVKELEETAILVERGWCALQSAQAREKQWPRRVDWLLALAQGYLEGGEPAEAAHIFDHAKTLAQLHQDRSRLRDTLDGLARAYLELCSYEKAERELQELGRLAEQLGPGDLAAAVKRRRRQLSPDKIEQQRRVAGQRLARATQNPLIRAILGTDPARGRNKPGDSGRATGQSSASRASATNPQDVRPSGTGETAPRAGAPPSGTGPPPDQQGAVRSTGGTVPGARFQCGACLSEKPYGKPCPVCHNTDYP